MTSKPAGIQGCAVSLNLFTVTLSLWFFFVSEPTSAPAAFWSMIRQKPVSVDELEHNTKRNVWFL